MPVATRPPRAPASRLGARVRALRAARRLTQAQLAGDDFTKGFISLVETGRSNVSLKAAEIFAGRLGVTVSDLIGPADSKEADTLELTLLRAEQALASGNATEAIAVARKSTPRAAGLMRARFQRLHARGLNQTARTPEAIRLLDESLRQFRAARQREYVVRTLFDLAVAHSRIDQLNEALNLALECERALNASELVDRTFELQVLTFLANVFVGLGDSGSADLRAERAAHVAQDISDPATLGALYAGLSQTREEQGDLEAALLYARKSLDMYERLGHAMAVGSAWNTIGSIYVQRQQYGRATEALEHAGSLATEQRNGRLFAYVLQSQAELAFAQGRHADAVRLAEESAKHPDATERARALSLLVKAEALARRRAPARQVDAAFRDALTASRSQPRRLQAKARSSYADVLAARGRPREAFAEAKAALELLRPAISS